MTILHYQTTLKGIRNRWSVYTVRMKALKRNFICYSKQPCELWKSIFCICEKEKMFGVIKFQIESMSHFGVDYFIFGWNFPWSQADKYVIGYLHDIYRTRYEFF